MWGDGGVFSEDSHMWGDGGVFSEDTHMWGDGGVVSMAYHSVYLITNKILPEEITF